MNYLLFALCVSLATYMQGLTGFAFSLTLLGLSSMFHLASVSDVANAATVLGLINAAVYFRLNPLTPQWRVMWPAMPASVLCVGIGLWLLKWLSGNAVQILTGSLGITIILSATLLLQRNNVHASPSGPMTYARAGALSGLLGGLFSAAGPPFVFHMYRQPLERQVIQQCLFLMFAVNGAIRLILVLGTGHISHESVMLSAYAVPTVYAVNRLQHRFPSKLDVRRVKWLVSGLLMLTGATLVASSLR